VVGIAVVALLGLWAFAMLFAFALGHAARASDRREDRMLLQRVQARTTTPVPAASATTTAHTAAGANAASVLVRG
jgi:hypothetical protein